MRIVIVGAGEVGSNIASTLASTHEVVVIDRDPERVEELTYSLDVLAKEGDGTSLAYAEGGDLNDPVVVGVQARGLAVHDDTVPETPAEALPELVVRGAWVHEASL